MCLGIQGLRFLMFRNFRAQVDIVLISGVPFDNHLESVCDELSPFALKHFLVLQIQNINPLKFPRGFWTRSSSKVNDYDDLYCITLSHWYRHQYMPTEPHFFLCLISNINYQQRHLFKVDDSWVKIIRTIDITRLRPKHNRQALHV